MKSLTIAIDNPRVMNRLNRTPGIIAVTESIIDIKYNDDPGNRPLSFKEAKIDYDEKIISSAQVSVLCTGKAIKGKLIW